MNAITFLLNTEQPILATSFQGDPNSDVSYPYIPGSMIRGALIGRYLRQNPSKNSDIVADETVRRLFFNGQTRYLNAYLFTKDSNQPRSLPTPRSWFQNKGEQAPMDIYDLSGMELAELPQDVSAKKLPDGFCTVRDRSVTLYNEQRRINIHNQRDRRRGRATEEIGEIFRYEALDKGQTFQSVVLCEDADVTRIENLLRQNENLWLGGSQSAGYGHTKITEIHPPHKTWNEVGNPIENRLNRSSLQITLLSDAIVQNELGQYVVEPPIYLLAEALGLAEKLLRNKFIKSYIGHTLIGGFNRKWGLPLPQVTALAAGSVFVFDKIPMACQQIADLEWQGIGERRVDGFGRIAVNWLNLQENSLLSASLPQLDISSTDEPKLPENSESAKLAKKMAERVLRQKLDTLLLNKVGNVDLKCKVSNSQLSRLMILARQAINENGNIDLVINLLGNLNSNASSQFEDSKVGKKSLERQLREWIEHPTGWLNDLQPVTIAGETCDLTEDLAKEYTLRLIMAVAKKASKEKNND